MSLRAACTSISETAKKAISAGISGTPPSRFGSPKVSRVMPPTGSMPLQPSSMPSAAAIMPFSSEPPETAATQTSPKVPRAKYSTEVNSSAKLARFGAASIRTRIETNPPMKEETTDRLTARSALPRRAMR